MCAQWLSRVRLFVTPWTVASGSSVHGILPARILEWVAMPSSRGSSWPRDPTWVSYIAGRFFTTEPPEKLFYWSGLPCPTSGDLPDTGTEPSSPALQVDSLPLSPRGGPKMEDNFTQKGKFFFFFLDLCWISNSVFLWRYFERSSWVLRDITK